MTYDGDCLNHLIMANMSRIFEIVPVAALKLIAYYPDACQALPYWGTHVPRFWSFSCIWPDTQFR